MEKNNPTFIREILQNLSSKSPAIRYHSQYTLRNFSMRYSSVVITEFNKYFKSLSKLDSNRVINEITFMIQNLPPHDNTYLDGLQSIIQQIELLCNNSYQIFFVEEIQNLCTTFFTYFPDLFFKFCEPSQNMIISTHLAASQFLTSESKFPIIEKAELLLTFPPEPNESENNFLSQFSLFQKYSIVRFIHTLIPHLKQLSPESSQLLSKISSQFPAFYFSINPQQPLQNQAKQKSFAPFFSSLLEINLDSFNDKSRTDMLHKIAKITDNDATIAHCFIPSLIKLLQKNSKETVKSIEQDDSKIEKNDSIFRDEDVDIVVSSLIPTLSIIPFHFNSSLLDDKVASGYDSAVQVVLKLWKSFPRVLSQIVNVACRGSKLQQRLGCQYCITCMIKLGAIFEYEEIEPLFSKIESPLEAGSISEVALSALSHGIKFMNCNVKEIVELFESCFILSNEMSNQFPLDAMCILGKLIGIGILEKNSSSSSSSMNEFNISDISEFFTFLSEKLQSKLKFAALYFSMLDSFVYSLNDDNYSSLNSLPSKILIYLCLFKSLNPSFKLQYFDSIEPKLKSSETILSIIDNVTNASSNSNVCRSILNKYESVPSIRHILCNFLIRLIPHCNEQDALSNATSCISILQNDFEANIELISSVFAAFIEVDSVMAIQSLTALIQSKSKIWFLFSFSSPINAANITTLVFKILLKIKDKDNVINYLQFASEHLPDQVINRRTNNSSHSSSSSSMIMTNDELDDSKNKNIESDVNCSQFVLKSLATIFRKFPELNHEFPPKCRLFDFVVSVGQHYPDNDDVFRCLSTLLPIPPVNQVEQIPIVTSLVMNSSKITDELLLMLKSTLLIAETPYDIKLLLEPFVKQLNASIINCRKNRNRKKQRLIYDHPNNNNNNNYEDIENFYDDSDEDFYEDFDDCLNGIHYSLLLSILESLAGHGNHSNSSSGYSTQDNNDNNNNNNIDNNNDVNVNSIEKPDSNAVHLSISDDSLDFDFPPLGIDVSSKLKLNEKMSSNVSYDSFLEMMAESIGICLPIFEKAHLAVHYILIIMGRLTQKFDSKPRLSLNEAVKYISSTFNSQCLFNVASLLCENQTMASVTAFIILLREREGEMLHYVQTFVLNLLNASKPNIPLIFEANETLAKAATSLISIEHFHILKAALKTTKHRNSILDVLKEMLVSKSQELKMILEDSELKSLVDRDSVEMQFVIILTDDNSPSDIKKWNKEKKLSFLFILEKYIDQLTKEQKLKFAHFISDIEEIECISKSIQIFSPFFHEIEFMTCFATSMHVLPVLLQSNAKSVSILKSIIPISLQNKEALGILNDVIHLMLYKIFKSAVLIQRIRKQNEIYILKRFIPLIASTLYGEFDSQIIELLSFITNSKLEQFQTPITSFVGLIETMEKLNFISDNNLVCQNCINSIFEKASKGTKRRNLCALVSLAFLCKHNILDDAMYNRVLYLIKKLSDDPNENVQAAVITCFSCFPLNIFLSYK